MFHTSQYVKYNGDVVNSINLNEVFKRLDLKEEVVERAIIHKPVLRYSRGKIKKSAGRIERQDTSKAKNVLNSLAFSKSSINKMFISAIEGVAKGEFKFVHKFGNYLYTIDRRVERKSGRNQMYVELTISYSVKTKGVSRSKERSYPIKTPSFITKNVNSKLKEELVVKETIVVKTSRDLIKEVNPNYSKIPLDLVIKRLNSYLSVLNKGLKKGIAFGFYKHVKEKNDFLRYYILTSYRDFKSITGRQHLRKRITKCRFLRTIVNKEYQGYFYTPLTDLQFKIFEHSPITLDCYLAIEEAQLYRNNSPHIFRVKVTLAPSLDNKATKFKFTTSIKTQYEKGRTEYLQWWDGKRFRPADDTRFGSY